MTQNVVTTLKKEIWDYIAYYDDIVSSDLCDKIVEFTNTQDLQPSVYANHKGAVTSNDRVKMDDIWFRENAPYYIDIKNGFMSALMKYQQENPFCMCKRHTDFRFNKYSKGGFMSVHCDTIHHSHGQEYGYPQVTSLLFLNDDYDGGEFVVSGRIYNTKKGSAILFPSNFMYPHEVKTIMEGIRYSIVTWLM